MANETVLNMNTTSSQGLTPLYQPVLNRQLIDVTKTELIHHQFGQKARLEKGKGKIVAWDKMSPLPLAKTPLTEGITPEGTSMNISRVTGIPKQYGAYIATTDQFDFFTPDPSPEMLRINETLANNAGETLDALTADVLSTGLNVYYAGGKSSRSALTEGDIATIDTIREIVRSLKVNKAKRIDGKYVAIVHPDIAHDLMSDEKWIHAQQYQARVPLFEGEVGELYGVRFVESPLAMVFRGEMLAGNSELSIVKADASTKTIYIYETLTEEQAASLAARKVNIGGVIYTIKSATAGKLGESLGASIVLTEDFTGSMVKTDMKIYPGEGAASSKPVYSTLVLGADAYGVTDIKSTLENITKSLGSAGSGDPLNQRATMGWKAYHLCKILTDMYMVRLESLATA